MEDKKTGANLQDTLKAFVVEGITWHALTLEVPQFDAYKKMAVEVMRLPLLFEQQGVAVFQFQNGTLLELYQPTTVPAYGYNGSVAFGFRVSDIEAASAALEKAGFKLLADIVRVKEMNYAYRHFQGPDGLVFGLNEQN
jgi:predicted enzyme related to lactoylglutathione lyase